VSVRIKICGITRTEDAEATIALGAEMIGLNFYPPSPRHLTIDRAREIRHAIGRRAIVIGVFVNADRDYINEHLRELDLDMIQFHGDEEESELLGWPVKVIRAFRLRADALEFGSSKDAPPDTFPRRQVGSLPATAADYTLLDTFHPGLYGGTGEARPLAGLAQFDLTRVIISGGLNPDNVAQAAALKPFAIDVASGVESAPGLKDPAKLRSFIANAKLSR
jgi:phosphoribosylanthranilate isomerase